VTSHILNLKLELVLAALVRALPGKKEKSIISIFSPLEVSCLP